MSHPVNAIFKRFFLTWKNVKCMFTFVFVTVIQVSKMAGRVPGGRRHGGLR